MDGPIIAAVHNSNLDEILEHIPSHRWNDLVFVQGGMILPWLEEKGISDFTLALLYLSAFVDTNGEPQVIDGGGKTVITGKYVNLHLYSFLFAKLTDQLKKNLGNFQMVFISISFIKKRSCEEFCCGF